MGETAFWELQQRTDKHLQSWDTVYRDRPRRYVAALDDTYASEGADAKNGGERAGTGIITGGLWAMGIGAIIAALGGLAYVVGAQDVALVLGVTIGPLTFIAGLLLLVIGALVYAVGGAVHRVQERRRSRASETQPAPKSAPTPAPAPAPTPRSVAPAPSPVAPANPTSVPSPVFDPNEPPPSYE